MTPEIKHRIGQIRRGEMPEGYNRVRDSIIPSDWKQYCLGELGKNKNGLNFHREDKGIKIRILGVGDFGNLSVLRDLNALSEISMRFMPDDELLLKNGDIVFVRSNGSKELVGRNLLVYPQNEKVSFSGIKEEISKNLCLCSENKVEGKKDLDTTAIADEFTINLSNKKLVSESDLRKPHINGVRTLIVDKKAIITPLAKDYIRINNLNVVLS